MLFETVGTAGKPAVLFFHAMGVTGASSRPVAEALRDRYFCILPTSSVYCPGQRYVSREKELDEIEAFLEDQGVEHLALVTASSIGADLATAFLARTKRPVDHAYFDGGQFAQIGRSTRRIMVPFLYLAIKSLDWTDGRTLKRILWCDDDSIKPYFLTAAKALTYGNLRRQLADSLEDRPFPALDPGLQRRSFWAFGSAEDHYKYREAVKKAYPQGNFPVFRDHQHMQFQIRDPRGFGEMLACIMETGGLPELPFLQKPDPH